MTSILKVSTIQNTAGGAPTAADLGIGINYFQVNVTQQNYLASAGNVDYELDTFIGNGATFNDSTDTITVTDAGVWQINLFLSCAATGNASVRWQENYVYQNATKILDSRSFIYNVDQYVEYYAINASRIVNVSSGDTFTLSGNGQVDWSINSGDQGSNFNAIRLA